ncbi:uncharacterized protein LOC131221158 isoform X2 [Magnolia sinica]|uniref:uncharacterized protein LOC131221158 isoform X2 n=1 Tax=Magnolia sinica TaxID=86752 RepID=UPI00265943FE|nr:uncharacterized protein LOC131221158 isoform X2 [Magnolia sinica]
MRQYAGAMLHHLDKVKYLTTMELPLFVAMILLFMVFTLNKSMEGQSSPNREETDCLLPQACSNDTRLEGTPGNHTPERTNSGNGTQPVRGPNPQSLPEIDTRQTQSDNVAQRETPARASSPQTENVNVNMTELSLSWVVIGFSAGAIIAFMGLLGNNNQISNHMAFYEAGMWLLYTSLLSGIIMLMNSIFCKFPCTFSYGFMSLAVVSGTYAISFGIYLLLPKSKFRLLILTILPGALFLVAAIFYFKDRIITTARSFWFKQHENYGSISANETEMAEIRQNIDA